MTTDPIVEAIDQELERLRTIRTILLPLLEFESVPAAPSIIPIRRTPKPHRATSPSASVSEPAISSETSVSVAATPEITHLPSRQPPVRRIRKPRFETSQGALAGAVPSAPVVVRPVALTPIEPPAVILSDVAAYSFAAMVRAAEQEMRPPS